MPSARPRVRLSALPARLNKRGREVVSLMTGDPVQRRRCGRQPRACPPDMQRGRSPKLHLRPFQLAGLLGAQAVTVGHKDQGGVPMAPSARLRRLEQLLDLVSRRLGVCGPGRRQGGDPHRGGHLLRDATGGARGDIVQEIIAIVRQVASGLPPEQPDPLDDGLPGG
jgi:hypothetical protein